MSIITKPLINKIVNYYKTFNQQKLSIITKPLINKIVNYYIISSFKESKESKSIGNVEQGPPQEPLGDASPAPQRTTATTNQQNI